MVESKTRVELGQDHIIPVWQHGKTPTTRCDSWHDSGTTRQDALPGCHHLARPKCGTWENALAKALARLKACSKRNLSIHNCALIVCTMILPTVDHVLSAAPAPTRALCLLEKNITQFLWDGPDDNRRRPMVDRATLARPHIHGGLNCPLVKDIADSRRVALWTCALYLTEDWACALKKRVLDETGVNGTAFLHKRIPCTNNAQQIIVAFKRLRWAYPDDALPHGLKKHE